MNTELIIENTPIGNGHPMFIIGEVGLAHDGSLGMAHSYIDAVANTGANAVKFQTHLAEYESSPFEQFRVKVFPQDETRCDYWNRTAFNKKQWHELAAHAREVELIFLSSPFSHEAVDLLETCGMPAWKIASGEVSNLPLLRRLADTGKPILISSGMSSWLELDEAVGTLKSLKASFGMFQCTTSYPCPPETWGLNIIDEIEQRYNCCTGLSDHSGDIYAGIAGMMKGASMLEVHVVFDRAQFGPDVKSSLTFEQLAAQVQGIRQIETAISRPVDKDAIAVATEETRKLFSKSLYAAADLKSGQIVSQDEILIRKPLIGIPAAQLDSTIGKKLIRPIERNHPITLDHFE